MSSCPHWLDMTRASWDCDLPLGHKGKHVHVTGGEGVGDRPRKGKARKDVAVRIEWDR